jgi:hypothetical protein
MKAKQRILAPQDRVARHTGDLEHDFTQMPFIADPWQAMTDLVGKRLAELAGPLPHGLVAHDDASGGEHLLDYPQAQRKAEIEPDGVADELRREPVAGVQGLGRWRYTGPVAVCPPAGNLTRLNLTVPVHEFTALSPAEAGGNVRCSVCQFR